MSALGRDFIDRILNAAPDICLILNSSVNAYRRLDPHFEAPNQIKASAIDRGAMIRIPIGNEGSARIEVRSVAPDANPYLSIYHAAQGRPRRAAVGSRKAQPQPLPPRQHLRSYAALPRQQVREPGARP